MLNPRVDFAFKKLFGNEEHHDILISFINAVIAPATPVTSVRLLNPALDRDRPADKMGLLDIKAIDEQGQHYNIEMQITDEVYYNQRVLYYWSRLYASQLKMGQRFDSLNKTISINVLNFNCFSEETDYHNVFRILNVRSKRCYFEDLELHFIELKKFNKDLQHLENTLDRWTTFLAKAERYNRDTLPAELKQEPAIDKAIRTLETLYLNDEEREIYEARLKWLRDETAALQKAELKGLERGIEKGIEKVAQNLLQQGLAIDAIATATGLTIEDLNRLQKSVDE